MKTIGIKLADGSFYPVLEEGKPARTTLDLTTVNDNQTTVQVDLYRSETGTMEDAEYVDSLQIDNLVEHPNGEPDISLNLNLDDDNKLSAEINDPESGGHSQNTITLVSRTLEERTNPTNFELASHDEETEEETPPVADNGSGENAEQPDNPSDESTAAAGGGLEAAAEAYLEEQDNNEQPETTDFTNTTLPDFSEETADETSTDDISDISIDESELAALESEENDESEISSLDNPIDEPFSFDAVEEEAAEQDTVPEEETETPEQEESDEQTVQKGTAEEDELSEQENDLLSDTENEPQNTAEQDDDFTDTLSFATKSMDEQDSPVPENFDLPDFDDTEFGTKTVSPEETVSFDDAGLDDGTEEPHQEQTAEAPELTDGTDIFAPDAEQKSEESSSETMFNPAAASQPLDFTDLYDKETKKGETASYQEKSGKKKTTIPMMICIICALICIAATILVLFVVPSKINLLKSRNTKTETVQTEPVPDESAAAPLPAPTETPVQQAEPVQNEIVVAEPEAVTPEPPKKPVREPENITYKIRWGDTLWDLADTYYRNPWRYHEIARYNNIKDPDYIISGTYITIPEK